MDGELTFIRPQDREWWSRQSHISPSTSFNLKKSSTFDSNLTRNPAGREGVLRVLGSLRACLKSVISNGQRGQSSGMKSAKSRRKSSIMCWAVLSKKIGPRIPEEIFVWRQTHYCTASILNCPSYSCILLVLVGLHRGQNSENPKKDGGRWVFKNQRILWGKNFFDYQHTWNTDAP